uniref:Uncharacterized protein n=1 Tax=Timema monikensis TaxID=170555 RepID=A0A7R9E986_9NEOP|nr:unnamed protein product [Timema monikensis]
MEARSHLRLFFLGVAFLLSRELNHTSVKSKELCVRERRSWHKCTVVRVQQGRGGTLLFSSRKHEALSLASHSYYSYGNDVWCSVIRLFCGECRIKDNSFNSTESTFESNLEQALAECFIPENPSNLTEIREMEGMKNDQDTDLNVHSPVYLFKTTSGEQLILQSIAANLL